MKNSFSTYLEKNKEVGFIQKVLPALVYAEGLPGASLYEVVVFENGELGQVMGLSPGSVEILSFGGEEPRPGSKIARTGLGLEVPVGEEYLGRVINPLGHSLDKERPAPATPHKRPIDVDPPGIKERARIRRQFFTGTALVDLMLPLGKGQRELIIGDQKTGKSRFAMRVMLTQVRNGAVGIYAAIGKSQSAIKQLEQWFGDMEVLNRILIVASPAHSPAGIIFLTPFAAMAAAEYFRDLGKDVVLILDDLVGHAKTYREISLLGRRFPGRSAYPGDIFYLHSRLLERAGNFLGGKGDVSITCLPLVETAEGDLSGYIQTNSMSMTDGHIFFDRSLFITGKRPAVHPFLSVTRVGIQTQSMLAREIGFTLTTFLRNMERLRNFAGFGAELSEHLEREFEKEARMAKFLDQTGLESFSHPLQIFLFGMVWGGPWKDKKLDDLSRLLGKAVLGFETKSEFRDRISSLIQPDDSLAVYLATLNRTSWLKELFQ